MPKGTSFLIVFGVGLIVVSSLLFHFVPIIIDDIARSSVEFTHPSSGMYKGFQNASKVTDIYYSFYLFNLTNPSDVENGAEAIVEEIGPYVYLSMESVDAESIKWHPNATVEYAYQSYCVFQPLLSGKLTEDDVFITPNLGWIGTLKAGLGTSANDAAAKVNATFFMKLSIKQIVWGYNNTILEQLIRDGLFFLDPVVQIMVKGSPDALRASRTPAAQYTGGVAAWNEPPSNPSQVVTMWNGMESLVDPLLGPFWGSTFANQLNGTLGSSYYTDMKMNVKYPVFVDDLFRSVYLTATTSITYQGAGLYRYTIDQSSFVSEKVNPDNAAFYIQDTGFIARPPQKQQPVWISKARFLHCNMSAVKMSIIPEVNVDANWESYDVAIDVEPITGQVFQAHKRYQINTRFVQGLTVPPTLPKLVETYYPVLWIDYHTALPRRETDLFVNSVVVPKRAVRISTIIGMTIGSLLLMGALVRMVRAQQQQGDSPVAHEDSEVINARKTLVPAEEDGVNNAKRISTVKYT